MNSENQASQTCWKLALSAAAVGMARCSLANDDEAASAGASASEEGSSESDAASSSRPKGSKKKGCDCCSHRRTEAEEAALKMEETEEMRVMMVKTLMHTFPGFCRYTMIGEHFSRLLLWVV